MDGIASVVDWLTNLSGWLQTDDRGNMVFGVLALCLLAELTIRVTLRFLSDMRAKLDVAKNSLRIDARLRRAPLNQR